MTNSSRRDNVFFALAFGLALLIRLLQLGLVPLNDSEATLALQALALAQGDKPALAASPLYLNLTTLGFFVFTATNFMARFWPAVAGALLVLAAYFFRAKLGAKAAIILAFGIAIDPGLLALSHTADGMMLALSCVMLAWALWETDQLEWSGIFAGLALLGGASVWAGLLGLGATRLLLGGQQQIDETEAEPRVERSAREKARAALPYAIGAFVGAGTLLFILPLSLSGAFSALVEYVKGWWTFSDVPMTRLLIALPVYEILPLVFALIALVRGILRKDRRVIGLGIWLGVALALALAYPARQVVDLTWALLPLWVLAALEIAEHVALPQENAWETAGMFILTLSILIFAWFVLANLARTPDPETFNQRLFLMIGALLLLGVSTVLVGFGWSAETARLGGLGGLLAFLTFFTLGAGLSAAGLHTAPTQELWTRGAAMDQVKLLTQTVNDFSNWSSGVSAAQPVTLMEVDSPALRWALRARAVTTLAAFDSQATAPFIVTRLNAESAFTESYRGQDFALRDYPAWETYSPTDWISWVTSRSVAVGQDQVILWVRNDLFLDAQDQQVSP